MSTSKNDLTSGMSGGREMVAPIRKTTQAFGLGIPSSQSAYKDPYYIPPRTGIQISRLGQKALSAVFVIYRAGEEKRIDFFGKESNLALKKKALMVALKNWSDAKDNPPSAPKKVPSGPKSGTKVPANGNLDPLEDAYNQAKSDYESAKDAYDKAKKTLTDTTQSRMSELAKQGITFLIAENSRRISANRQLDLATYELLRNQSVYVYLLHSVIVADGIKDKEGIYFGVLNKAEEIKKVLYNKITDLYVVQERINLSDDEITVLKNKVKDHNVSIEAGHTTEMIKDLQQDIEELGGIPGLIDQFLSRPNPEIESDYVTPNIRRQMERLMVAWGVKVHPAKLASAPESYDEVIFNAYTEALRTTSGGQDPISGIYGPGRTEEWDFSVDLFESVEERGIIRENILSASVLDYVRIMGDAMGIFKVVDTVIMRWVRGQLDVPFNDVNNLSNKLYRYHKQRKDRFSNEERGMYYKQIFNFGDSNMLEGMSVNKYFPQFWQTLMEEAVKYIQKVESKDNGSGLENISRRPIYQATKDLQYNLTVHSPGFVKKLVDELHNNQFKAATEILNDPIVVNQLGRGFQKNMWNVIERVSMEDFGYVPNISSLHAIAINSNHIFRWIADFEENAVDENRFQQFLSNAEAYIIEQGQLENNFSDINAENGMDEFDEEAGELDGLEDDWDF